MNLLVHGRVKCDSGDDNTDLHIDLKMLMKNLRLLSNVFEYAHHVSLKSFTGPRKLYYNDNLPSGLLQRRPYETALPLFLKSPPPTVLIFMLKPYDTPSREYWMIYRGPGFLAVVGLLAHPLPPSPESKLSPFLRLPLCPGRAYRGETAWSRGGGRVAKSHTTARKPGPL